MELWVPITIAAAFLQNLRSALQRRMSAQLDTMAATAARFVFAAPFAALYLGALLQADQRSAPSTSTIFFAWAVLGGLAQILGTYWLLTMFRYRNFAVGTAWSKTETVQAALFSALFLGERLTLAATLAIGISLMGLMALSLPKGGRSVFATLLLAAREPATRVGLASGAAFGISAVSYRAASLSLADDSYLISAATTLAWVTAMQGGLMLAVMAARARPTLLRLFQHWRSALWIGLAGMSASACWFTAMTLENVAYVRALGQVELVFTFLLTVFWFRERVTVREWIGISVLVVGILMLLLGR